MKFDARSILSIALAANIFGCGSRVSRPVYPNESGSQVSSTTNGQDDSTVRNPDSNQTSTPSTHTTSDPAEITAGTSTTTTVSTSTTTTVSTSTTPTVSTSTTSTPGTVTPPAVDVYFTKGKGGITGNEQELKSSSGLTFRIAAPVDAHSSGKAYGVLVLLHGSGASSYKEFIGKMKKVSEQYNLIRVSVLAPNGQGWNEGGQIAAADSLHDLVQKEVFAKYNIDKRRVLFSGQSSGAGFLSTNFVPQHAADYTGGAFMQCGAGTPSVKFSPDDATKKNFHLHFEITSGDPIWPKLYKAATEFYPTVGMSLTKENTKMGGHCAFDQQQIILDHINEMLPK